MAKSEIPLPGGIVGIGLAVKSLQKGQSFFRSQSILSQLPAIDRSTPLSGFAAPPVSQHCPRTQRDREAPKITG